MKSDRNLILSKLPADQKCSCSGISREETVLGAMVAPTEWACVLDLKRAQSRTIGCNRNRKETSGRDQNRRFDFGMDACHPANKAVPTVNPRLAAASGTKAAKFTAKA